MDSGQIMNCGIPLETGIFNPPFMRCIGNSKTRTEMDLKDSFVICLRISLVLYLKRILSLCRVNEQEIINSYRDLGSPHTILQLLPNECQQYCVVCIINP